MVTGLLTPERRDFALQAMRFAVVGVVNTLTCYVTIWLIRVGFDAPVWVASAGGYTVGTMQSFVLNRAWTFAGVTPDAKVHQQAAAFVGVNIVCGLVFTGINVVLHRWLSLPVSSLLGTAIVTPLSFMLNRLFVFKPGAS